MPKPQQSASSPYRWSNGSTGSSVTVTSNKSYSVTATSTYKYNPSLSESRTASYYVSTIITGYNWYLYESSNPSGWAQSKLIRVVVAGPDGGSASSFMASSGWSGGGSSGSGLSFTATANGSYTVWARDILSKPDSISVTVSGIDRDSPIINTPSVSVSGSTATVTATISDSASGVDVKKWASGSQSESYFVSSGTSFSGSSFTVTANGTYTIYAKDNAGNTTVRQVSVSEIGAIDTNYYSNPVTSTNAYRSRGWTGASAHNGVDIAALEGTTIYASHGGTATFKYTIA
ncbi:MAG TPA: hypothetical protein VJX95_05920 [Oscillospiraceae bacterium]|nr:hypothetical protein [Oscillospiraceae bacterium]